MSGPSTLLSIDQAMLDHARHGYTGSKLKDCVAAGKYIGGVQIRASLFTMNVATADISISVDSSYDEVFAI